MKPSYTPDAGDLVTVDFDPTIGHEQGGRRPALVLSPKIYNTPTGLCLVVPITSRVKNYPFEMKLPDGLPASGVILADLVRSIDYTARNIRHIGSIEKKFFAEVIARIRLLLPLK